MKIGQYEFPDELFYDKYHSWAQVENNVATVGMSDFGQALADDIVYVEAPRVGRSVAQGASFMSLESGKWVGRVKAIVSGKIVAVNEELEWQTTLVNSSPYQDGWFVKIEMNDPAELEGLMRATDSSFGELIAAEREKYGK